MRSRFLIASFMLFSASSFSPVGNRIDELGIVRIRATISENSHAYSTGTHLGEGWILTCGHCCQSKLRDVEIRILSARDWQQIRSVRGTIICHDTQADIGLIRMEPGHGLSTAHSLAQPHLQLHRGEEVLMYDWDGDTGDEQLYSTRQQITGVNIYLGPDSIETTGMPNDGASGGPLVRHRSGLIIGVTTAANIDDQRAIHTGLEPIYRLLQSCGYRATASPKLNSATVPSQL